MAASLATKLYIVYMYQKKEWVDFAAPHGKTQEGLANLRKAWSVIPRSARGLPEVCQRSSQVFPLLFVIFQRFPGLVFLRFARLGLP